MVEEFTNAEEMARAVGLLNGKTFRSRLRLRLPEHHERGSWRTLVGSAKHEAMQRELTAMIAKGSAA